MLDDEFDCPAGLAITSQAGGDVPKQVRHLHAAETLRQMAEICIGGGTEETGYSMIQLKDKMTSKLRL